MTAVVQIPHQKRRDGASHPVPSSYSRRGLFHEPAEETPYLFGGVHILLGPAVSAVYDLVEPDFVAAGAPDEAVRHHGMPPQGQRIGLFAHAAVGGDPVAEGDLDGQIGAPAALVFQIALPRGGAIFGTVDLEERDRRRRVAVE